QFGARPRGARPSPGRPHGRQSRLSAGQASVILMSVRFLFSGALVLLIALLVLLGVRLALQRLRRARPVPRALPIPRYPIVLAHGLFGFDAIEIGARTHEYFRGIPDRLRGLGVIVHAFRVDPTRGVASRARQLADHVRAMAAPRVNIIAHSMGGLDARYAI